MKISLSPISQTFGKSYHFLITHLRPLFFIALVMQGLQFIVQLGMVFISQNGNQDFIKQPSVIIIGAIIMILAYALTFLGYGAMILFTRDPAPKSDISPYLRESGTRFFDLLWTAILTTLLVMLGFIALIIPGIIISLSFSLGLYVAMAEKKSGWEALQRSRDLIKGNWWAIAGRLAILPPLYLLLSFPQLVIDIMTPNYIFYTTIYAALITMFYTAFGIIYTNNIYNDLVEKQKNIPQ